MDPTVLVTQIIAFVEAELPNIMSAATAATITRIIGILEQVISLGIQLAPTIVTAIKNIIAALKTSGPVTTDQLDQLDAIEAKLDADFDAAAAAAGAT
jgi:hypothetical protein